jgi:hypothetical protein
MLILVNFVRRRSSFGSKRKSLVDAGRYAEAQQALKNILALPSGGVHRTDAQQYLDQASQLQAEKYLAGGDFQSARGEASALKEKRGNPTELIVKIDQAELHERNKLKNQFDQLKQRNDNLSIQGLTALQPKFQTLAVDGGPQSPTRRLMSTPFREQSPPPGARR